MRQAVIVTALRTAAGKAPRGSVKKTRVPMSLHQ